MYPAAVVPSEHGISASTPGRSVRRITPKSIRHAPGRAATCRPAASSTSKHPGRTSNRRPANIDRKFLPPHRGGQLVDGHPRPADNASVTTSVRNRPLVNLIGWVPTNTSRGPKSRTTRRLFVLNSPPPAHAEPAPHVENRRHDLLTPDCPRSPVDRTNALTPVTPVHPPRPLSQNSRRPQRLGERR